MNSQEKKLKEACLSIRVFRKVGFGILIAEFGAIFYDLVEFKSLFYVCLFFVEVWFYWLPRSKWES